MVVVVFVVVSSSYTASAHTRTVEMVQLGGKSAATEWGFAVQCLAAKEIQSLFLLSIL